MWEGRKKEEGEGEGDGEWHAPGSVCLHLTLALSPVLMLTLVTTSRQVADLWQAFYTSNCSQADPTCENTRESLGRCAGGGFGGQGCNTMMLRACSAPARLARCRQAQACPITAPCCEPLCPPLCPPPAHSTRASHSPPDAQRAAPASPAPQRPQRRLLRGQHGPGAGLAAATVPAGPGAGLAIQVGGGASDAAPPSCSPSCTCSPPPSPPSPHPVHSSGAVPPAETETASAPTPRPSLLRTASATPPSPSCTATPWRWRRQRRR